MVSSVSSGITAGSYVPSIARDANGNQTRGTTTGTVVRLQRGQNPREILGPNADALMTPQAWKQLSEQGYLDVQRQVNLMESNEGLFSIGAKLAAAFIGPSRSIGAIMIDPMFLEMLKDPNAQAGFGYTRVRSETLSILPRPQEAPPQRNTPSPEAPRFNPTQTFDPYRATRERRERDVEMRTFSHNPGLNPLPGPPLQHGEDNYVVTVTQSWIDLESGGNSHNNTTLSGSMHELRGNNAYDGQTTNYMITSAYFDGGQFAPGVDNGTRNGREMGNTVATYGSGFLGQEIIHNRGVGRYNEYNFNYNFMTLGHMAKLPVKGDPHLTQDYINLSVADFQRRNPNATPEQIDQERSRAQQAVENGSTARNGVHTPSSADVFMLKTQNTMIGTGPETRDLRERYSQLLAKQNPPVNIAANDPKFNNITMSDFYALQYNDAVTSAGRPRESISVSVDSNGHVSGIDTGEMRTISNFRVVAETNFGRRVGESLVMGNTRTNDFVRRNNPNKTDEQLGDKLLTRSDAADVNVTTEQITTKLEELGLGFTDAQNNERSGLNKSGQYRSQAQETDIIVNAQGRSVALVPNGMRSEIMGMYNRLPQNLKNQHAGVINQMQRSPSVVSTEDMAALFGAMRSQGIQVRGGLESRVARPQRVPDITTQEWREVLGDSTHASMISDSDPRATQQAKNGNFVIAGNTTTASDGPRQASPDEANAIKASFRTAGQPGVGSETITALGAQVEELKSRGVDLSQVMIPNPLGGEPAEMPLSSWYGADGTSPGPLQQAVTTVASRPGAATEQFFGVNINELNQPGTLRGTGQETTNRDDDWDIVQAIDTQTVELAAQGVDLSTVKLRTNTTDPATYMQIGDPPRDATLADWGTVNNGQLVPGNLRNQVIATATQAGAEGPISADQLISSLGENSRRLDQAIAGHATTNIAPGTANKFRPAISEDIAALRAMGDTMLPDPANPGTSIKASDLAARYETELNQKLDNLTILEGQTATNSSQNGSGNPSSTGNYLDDLNGSMDQFQNYLQEYINNGGNAGRDPIGPANNLRDELAQLRKPDGTPAFSSTELGGAPDFGPMLTITPQQLIERGVPQARANEIGNRLNGIRQDLRAGGGDRVATLRNYSNQATEGLRNYLSGLTANGQPVFRAGELGTPPQYAGMFAINKQQLTAAGVPEQEADKIISTIERVRDCHVSVNMSSEANHLGMFYQDMRGLNQRLDNFHNVEVVKNAFRGEMQNLAKNNAPAFDALMRNVYGLPDPATMPDGPDKERVNQFYTDFRNLAVNGNLPVPPNIAFVDRSALGGGNAAYLPNAVDPDNPQRGMGPTILIASDLIDKPERLQSAFTEEMFHHLERSPEVQGLMRSTPEQIARETAAQGTFDEKEIALRNAMHPDRPPITSPEELTAAREAEDIYDLVDLQVPPTDPEQLEAFNAWNTARVELSAVQHPDAEGDEGRAGLAALREIRRTGNGQSIPLTELNQNLGRLTDEARQETAQVSGNVRRSEDAFDQGVLQSDLFVTAANGERVRVATQGAVMEFSSGTEDPEFESIGGTNVSETDIRTTSQVTTPEASNTNGLNIQNINSSESQATPMEAVPDMGHFGQTNWEDVYGQVPTMVMDAFLGDPAAVTALQQRSGGTTGPNGRLGQKVNEFDQAIERYNTALQNHDAAAAQQSLADAQQILDDVLAANGQPRGSVSVNNMLRQDAPAPTAEGQPTPPPQFSKISPEDARTNRSITTNAEEPGFWEKLGKGAFSLVRMAATDGLIGLGNFLIRSSENLDKLIKEKFYGKNGVLANCRSTFKSHDVIYGKGGGYGQDADALVGQDLKGEDYNTLRNNHRTRRMKDLSGKPNYAGVLQDQDPSNPSSELQSRDRQYRQRMGMSLTDTEARMLQQQQRG